MVKSFSISGATNKDTPKTLKPIGKDITRGSYLKKAIVMIREKTVSFKIVKEMKVNEKLRDCGIGS